MVSTMLFVWLGFAIGNVLFWGLKEKKWAKVFELSYNQALILLVVYLVITFFPPPG